MTRILLVDDEAPLLKSTGLLLESLNFRVTQAGDHREVLEAIRRERPDVILHDVRMPGLDWQRHLAHLRSDPVARDVPIILFSAHLALDDLKRELGVQGTVTKPCRPQDLVQAIEGALHPRV